MTDDMTKICERWEEKGFEDGFLRGFLAALGIVAIAAVAGWWLK